MSDYFGSEDHIKSMPREKLEEFALYVMRSRAGLEMVIRRQSTEIYELRNKVANQAHQLKEVQTALERRNQGELKARWQRKLDKLEREIERLREVE